MARKDRQRQNEGCRLGLEYTVVDSGTLLPTKTSALDGMDKVTTWTSGTAGGLRVGLAKPAKDLMEATEQLASAIERKDLALQIEGRLLLPTGVHPFASIEHLKEATPVAAPWTGKLFDLSGHGSVNSRATRWELPMAGDEDFGRLHTAIRMVLPLIPALSASSPLLQGKRAGALSARIMSLFDGWCRFPELGGSFIPEVALDQEDYYRIVLQPIARTLAREGLADSVDYHQVNVRLAVPQFDQGVISISAADVQECPSSDAAIAEMAIAVINAMKAGRWVSNYLQRAWHESDLLAILKDVARSGGGAVITNKDFLLMFGMMRESATAAELWRRLYQELRGELSEAARARVALILDHGCLAQRILDRLGDRPSRERIMEIYRELAACLKENKPFI